MKIHYIFSLCFLFSWVYASNFYDNNPHIMELTPKSFDRAVQRTNYTTLVEFYAPWCGHCQNLKEPMEKLAKSIDGLIQVAAVNCALPKNKLLCAKQLVQHFPTLMVYRPPKYDLTQQTSKKSSPHIPEVYNGDRSVKSMLDFCLSRIKSYVQKWSSADLLSDIITQQKRSKYSLLLISKKNKLSASYKSIAIDWLGIIDFHHINCNKLQNSNQLTLQSHPNIEKFLKSLSEFDCKESTLVLFDKEADAYNVYDGDITKLDISMFLAQYASPREGPLSKRGEYIMHLKAGSKPTKRNKKSSQHDEL